MTSHRLVRILLGSALAVSGLLMPAAVVGTHSETDASLPDLAMLQPDDFSLQRKPGGVRWLRFSTTIVNIGDGAFDVHGSDPDPNDASKLTKVTQRIEQNGGWVDHESNGATMFYAGDGHDHWHVLDLQRMELAYEATPNDAVATGAKRGFCFWDNVDLPDFGDPKYYEGTWACHLNQTRTTEPLGTVPMGLSVGWGDEYPSTIAFQYIDISNLPYGSYCLSLTADPNLQFFEKSTANNMVRTLISIQTGGVTVLAQDCAEDTTVPATPTGLTATPGDAQVALNWDDNLDTVAGYHVYRDSATEPIATVTDSFYADTGLTNEQTYCYEVTAFDASGNESARSGPECATPSSGTGDGDGGTAHVADLAGRAELKGQSGRWEVVVTVTIKDGGGSAVGGATVTGAWSRSTTGTVSGTTASDGTVTVSTGNLPSGTEVTYTVTDVTADGLTYDGSQPSITVVKP